MRAAQRTESRRQQYKKGIDADDARRKVSGGAFPFSSGDVKLEGGECCAEGQAMIP